MENYDPAQAPDAEEWLGLDEASRIRLALEHHRHARVRLPNATLHATIHAIVETQVALGDDTPVRRTLDRLQAEGLERHEAIHAIGITFVEQMNDLMGDRGSTGDPSERYYVALRNLTAESWRQAR